MPRLPSLSATIIAVGVLLSLAASSLAADVRAHHVVFQVDANDPAVMTMALNNISNLFGYYQERHEPVDVELVAFGPGLTMLRDDTSPVKPRLAALHAAYPRLVFSACENSRRGMSETEGKDVKIVAVARIVPSGVVRLTQLQEQGWSYIRP